MLNERVISVDIGKTQFVKKIRVTLSHTPGTFKNFFKEIGMKPNLPKIFKVMNADDKVFIEVIEKFDAYLKKSYDEPVFTKKDLDSCMDWMIALSELFYSVGKENKAKEIEDLIRIFNLAVHDDRLLKSHRQRDLTEKLFFKEEVVEEKK